MTSSFSIFTVKCKTEIFHQFNTFEVGAKKRKKNYHINWTDRVCLFEYKCVNMYYWNWRLNSLIQSINEINLFNTFSVINTQYATRMLLLYDYFFSLLYIYILSSSRRVYYLAHNLLWRESLYLRVFDRVIWVKWVMHLFIFC